MDPSKVEEKPGIESEMKTSLRIHDLPNLVPRAQVPFGQHQDTELWNNQFPCLDLYGVQR